MPTQPIQEFAERKSMRTLDMCLNEEQQEVFLAVIKATSIRKAVRWLEENHQIKVSHTAVGYWAAHQRRKAADERFLRLLGDIRHDNAQAAKLASEIGNAAQLNEANVTMLSAALFQASRSGDPAELKQAAKLFSVVMESTAKANAAEAAKLSAETSRDRFQFDAAKLALEHAEALQAIKASHGSDREKIERAVLTVFGRRPEPKTSTNSGGGNDVEDRPPVGKVPAAAAETGMSVTATTTPSPPQTLAQPGTQSRRFLKFFCLFLITLPFPYYVTLPQK